MKIKTLKFLFGIFFMLGVVYLACMPILFWHFWMAMLITNIVVILVVLYLFITNSPRASLHQFYDYSKTPNSNKYHRLRFCYRKQDHEYSCGPTVMQMKLEKYGIFMTQDEIMRFIGDKSLGTSHWEIEQALNEIFIRHQKPYRAKINYYANYALLEKQVIVGHGAIVLFMSKFEQKGFSSTATYPHFALLSYLSLLENKVILTTPASDIVNHGDGGYEQGDLHMSMEEFHYRLYAHTKYLRCLEYKPTIGVSLWKRVYNKTLNVMFRSVIFFAYYTRILKPGIAITIESVKE